MQDDDRAAIYCRISRDATGDGEGVERQERPCREVAERHGLEVIDVKVDNDIGASDKTSKLKIRTAYAALLEGARAGRYSHIIAYSISRLMRRMLELEYAAEWRDYWWQYVRDSKDPIERRGVIAPANAAAYPHKADLVSMKPVHGGGNNYGRLPRCKLLMDVFVEEALAHPILGIPAIDWQLFLKVHSENADSDEVLRRVAAMDKTTAAETNERADRLRAILRSRWVLSRALSDATEPTAIIEQFPTVWERCKPPVRSHAHEGGLRHPRHPCRELELAGARERGLRGSLVEGRDVFSDGVAVLGEEVDFLRHPVALLCQQVTKAGLHVADDDVLLLI
ncbi:recombinase family protein [Labedella populi]|uniref:Recombinase family protein n=1 Tax=Labedella populi TaxID=2498850 RepID=A0A3S4AUX5_9MICO|nr:recombinase family protein [Labedella populi]RWZ67942.1 recombinase family protein [Labedella populi]